MELRKIVRIIFAVVFLIATIVALVAAGYFIKGGLVKSVKQSCDITSSVVVLNRTDLAIEVTLRTKRGKSSFAKTTMPVRQQAKVDVGARACFDFSEHDTQLEYIAVSYNKRRYKFYDKQVLNGFPLPRYFAVMISEASDGTRAIAQAKAGYTFKERFKYLILSAYGKLGAVLGDDAKIQVYKIK